MSEFTGRLIPVDGEEAPEEFTEQPQEPDDKGPDEYLANIQQAVGQGLQAGVDISDVLWFLSGIVAELQVAATARYVRNIIEIEAQDNAEREG